MNRAFKRILRFTGRFLLGILMFIALYVLAVLLISRIPVNTGARGNGNIAIYINSNGVHTDIVVPVRNAVKDWSRDILYRHTRSADTLARYVAFGWGDKGFYLETPEWSDLKAGTAARAAFYLGTSAMHTCFYRQMTEDDQCVRVMITNEDYARLVQYIEDSFQKDWYQKPIWIPRSSYGSHDAFYEANGKYSLFYTCNTWTNNALKAAGQKAALWTVYDEGIFLHYK